MSGKVIMVFALLAALLLSSAGHPVQAKESNALQRLLPKRGETTHLNGSQVSAPRAHTARMDRRAYLTENDREIMTKQIMQAISEMNSECMSDRDYQGWLDFGRRDAD